MMKRILIILTLSVFALNLQAQRLTVLHLNDTHSHIDPQRSGKNVGMGGVIEQAAFVDSIRCAEGSRNVLLLHAGDFSQGTSYFTEMKGDIEIDVLNSMKFDAVCLGNHEFDNGIDELARRLKNLKVPMLCANYDFEHTSLKGLVKPYTIVKKAGKKIGIIGLLTDVSTVVDASIASSMSYQNPAETVNQYVEILKDKDCDLIICLTHLGYEDEDYTDLELAENISDVDIIVGGHSHTFLKDLELVKDYEGEDVVVVTDGKWGLNMGVLSVIFED